MAMWNGGNDDKSAASTGDAMGKCGGSPRFGDGGDCFTMFYPWKLEGNHFGEYLNPS